MNKKEQRRGLGRGLSALMADVEPALSTAAASDLPVRTVPIDSIRPNPDQPRRQFAPERLEELADSIRTKGVIQPLIVRPDPDRPQAFQIVAGERRWRAAQMAQLHEMPVLVRDFDDTEVLEVAIIENIQRADLTPIEEAQGYRQLMMKFGHTQEKMAEALGKSRSHIANLLRLLTLPDSVQAMVNDGTLSAGHARTLVTVEDAEALARRIRDKGLSVREAEKLARDRHQTARKPRRSDGPSIEKDADTRALEADIGAALGMSVRIDHTPGAERGKMTISYDTLDQLDALCGLLSTYR